MKLQDAVPVLLSTLIIVLVAILEKQSKLFAALTATMPLNAPLALWIVYSLHLQCGREDCCHTVQLKSPFGNAAHLRFFGHSLVGSTRRHEIPANDPYRL